MTNFQVGNRVRIKDTATFGLKRTHRAFEAAKRVGIVEATGDTLLHGGVYIVVYTPDRTAWEYFTPGEVELIEAAE